jgi:hypothetical protein
MDFEVGDKVKRVGVSLLPDEFGYVGQVYTVLSMNEVGKPHLSLTLLISIRLSL